MARAVGRMGAALVAVGLTIVGVGFAIPVDATPSAPVDVCSNQSGSASDCAEPAPVGSVTTEVRDGGVVFRITAAEGTTWNRLSLCIPGAVPSPADDCDPSSVSVLSPADGDYSVAGVTGLTTSATSASFDCTGSLTATVPRETLAGVNSPVPWALQLTSCAGGSDEAFGSVSRGLPASADYECSGVTGVTSTSATLHAATTDQSVTQVQFVMTKGSNAAFTDSDSSNGFSAVVTGLAPNTAYAYSARFLSASGTKISSEGNCLFATPAEAPTTTTTAPETTTTTAGGATTTTTAPGGETTTTTAPAIEATTTTVTTPTTPTTPNTPNTPTEVGGRATEVLPATLTRGAASAPAAVVPQSAQVASAGAQAAPAQLARTGSSTSWLTTLGLTLIALGAYAMFLARRRDDGELVPAPIDHPRVPLVR